jgi:hypothetical protein
MYGMRGFSGAFGGLGRPAPLKFKVQLNYIDSNGNNKDFFFELTGTESNMAG